MLRWGCGEKHQHGPCPGAWGLCGRTPSCSPNFCFHISCLQRGGEGFISSHLSLHDHDGGFPQQGRALSSPSILLPLLLHPSFLSSLSCYIHPPGCRRHPHTTGRAGLDSGSLRAFYALVKKKKKRKKCHGFWHRKGRWRWEGRGSARCNPVRSVGVICSALSHRACFCISVGA